MILPRDIGKALVFGVVISGLIAAFVAPQALESYLGGGLLPMLAAMAIGIPLYVCATASTPIALGLIHAGLSPGAALVFLISGPATNTAALTTLWKVLGRRTAILYLVTVAVASLATGLAVDGLIGTGVLPQSAMVPAATAMADSGDHARTRGGGPCPGSRRSARWPAGGPDQCTAAALEGGRGGDCGRHDGEQTVEIKVGGMRCNGCVQSVKRALSEIAGVTEAEVWLDEGLARVRGNGFSTDVLVAAVTALGFSAEG